MNTDNDLGAAERALISPLLASLPAGFALERVKLPGAEFTTPANQPWMRVGIDSNYGPISGDAAGEYEINRARFTAALFFPVGSGSQAAFVAARHIKALYSGEILGDLAVESVVVTPSPEPNDSQWYGLNIQITFTFEGNLT